jgi:hypothetical protein
MIVLRPLDAVLSVTSSGYEPVLVWLIARVVGM